jgi:glycosyltransferase involved in cell wall biosynthesis
MKSANSIKVSIVIPIYNAEKFLPECLDSVLAQTHENIEVICVDDGSTDGSLQLLRSYEEQDARVRVIAKPNGGCASARNAGIEQAKSDWILFHDADDVLAADCIEQLLAIADKCGAQGRQAHAVFSFCDVLDHNSGALSDNYIRQFFFASGLPEETSVNVREAPMLFRYMCLGPQGKLIKRDLIEENGIRFIALKSREDAVFFTHVMLAARDVAFTGKPLCHIRRGHETNICSAPVGDAWKDDLRALFLQTELMEEYGTLALHLRGFLNITITYAIRWSVFERGSRVCEDYWDALRGGEWERLCRGRIEDDDYWTMPTAAKVNRALLDNLTADEAKAYIYNSEQ